MFCACDIIQLFSAVFFMVKVVHTFDLKLAINKTSGSQWKYGHGVMDIHYFLRGFLCFPPGGRR